MFRANESLHLRRLLRVVEHGAALLEKDSVAAGSGTEDGDEKDDGCVNTSGMSTNATSGATSNQSLPLPLAPSVAEATAAAAAVGLATPVPPMQAYPAPAPATAQTLVGAGGTTHGAARGSIAPPTILGAKSSSSRGKRGESGGGDPGSRGGDLRRGLASSQAAVVALKVARIFAGAEVVPGAHGVRLNNSTGKQVYYCATSSPTANIFFSGHRDWSGLIRA